MALTELLDLEPAPGQKSQAVVWPAPTPDTTLAAQQQQQDRLAEIRRCSAYPNTRMLIQAGMGVLVLLELIMMGIAMDALQSTSLSATPVFGTVIDIVITIAVGNILLALLDMADATVAKRN